MLTCSQERNVGMTVSDDGEHTFNLETGEFLTSVKFWPLVRFRFASGLICRRISTC